MQIERKEELKMDDEKKILSCHVTFNVDIDENFKEEFKRIIDHHIDELIDTESFPEIKAIYAACVEIR